jgi:hypothetical protein
VPDVQAHPSAVQAGASVGASVGAGVGSAPAAAGHVVAVVRQIPGPPASAVVAQQVNREELQESSTPVVHPHPTCNSERRKTGPL